MRTKMLAERKIGVKKEAADHISAKGCCRTLPRAPVKKGKKKEGQGVVLPEPSSQRLAYGLNLIVSDAAAEMLRARSLYWTYTVLVPAPVLSVHDLLLE